MKYFRYFVVTIIVLFGAYTLFGIGHFKWMYHSVQNPQAEFLVKKNENAEITVVEFLNYGCGYCKQMHPTIEELLKIRKDIRYVARPVVFGDEAMQRLNKLVIAAGLQGKFWEMHDAVLSYPTQAVPEEFIKETAALYDIDYQKLVDDIDSKEVEKIAESNDKAASHAGIGSVPSFVIGEEIFIVTDENLPDLKDLLDMVS